VRSKLGKEMVQKVKREKISIETQPSGLKQVGLKATSVNFWLKVRIFYSTHDIKKQLHDMNLYMLH